MASFTPEQLADTLMIGNRDTDEKWFWSVDADSGETLTFGMVGLVKDGELVIFDQSEPYAFRLYREQAALRVEGRRPVVWSGQLFNTWEVYQQERECARGEDGADDPWYAYS